MPNIKIGILCINIRRMLNFELNTLIPEMSKTQFCDLHKQCRTVTVLCTVGHAMQVAWDTHDVNNPICITRKPKHQQLSNCFSKTQ